MNTPHPDLETLAELADRDLAPASDPATDPATDAATAEVLAHVAGCAACTADLEALRRVRDTLRALPPVPMPADVAERIEAALLAARTPDTVVPLRPRSTSAHRSGGAASRWRTMPYGAAASIVVVLALLVVGIVAIGHSGSDSKKSASSPAVAAAPTSPPTSATIASGTNYTTADIRNQVATVVTSNIPAAAANFPGLNFSVAQPAAGSAAPSAAAPAAAASSASAAATSAAAAAPAPASSPALPAQAAPTASASAGAASFGTAVNAASAQPITAPAGPLADPAALAACIQILAGKAEQPLLVDYALFNGVPSTIIVLPDPDVAHKLDIYVEADTANCSNKELTFETFLGPSPAP